MNTKYKVAICVVSLATAFAAGRWEAPTKTKIVTQTVEVEKKTDTANKDVKQDTHTKTVIHEVHKPDGTDEKYTTITRDTGSQTHQTDKTTDQATDVASSSTEITRDRAKVTISALFGVPISFSSGVGPLVYGASVSKPILGPIAVGVWGFNNGTIGTSVGLTF